MANNTRPEIQDIPGEVVKFNDVLKCNVLRYIEPKDEDDEYYQLCNIDAAGKLQRASTRFKFLEQSAELQDDAIDIKMIHKEKEMASTGTDGSQVVQQIDTKLAMKPDFGNKSNELKQDLLDMQLRLQMDLGGEGNSQDSQVASEQTSDGAHATTVAGRDLSTQAIQAPTNQATQGSQVEGTNEDLEEMRDDMSSVSKALEEKEKEVDRLKRVIMDDKIKQESLMMDFDRQTEEMKEQKKKLQQQSNEKETNREKISSLNDSIQHLTEKKRERERRFQAKTRSQKLKIDQLVEKNRKIRDDFTNMKHTYEGLMTYYNRWAVMEDRLQGRPPRCMAITLEGILCKRYGKIVAADFHLCLQHARMANSVP